MQVKVGDTWYNCKDQPILVALSEAEKDHIARMPVGYHRYSQWVPGRDCGHTPVQNGCHLCDRDIEAHNAWMDAGWDEAEKTEAQEAPSC